ncbi:MAG: hypothetical protein JNK85_20755, partial [Verrucomicrobiales bacterium]|nr:hypothetical protein [Verrucomicrobiales bacterium]
VVTDQMLLEPGEEVYLLPAKTRYEQDGGGIETTTERRVMFSPELPRHVGEARAEWRILRDLAVATWPDRAANFGCETGHAIREEIARVVPFYEGVQRLEKTGDAIQWGGERLCEGARFGTADGKGHFRPVPLPPIRTALPMKSAMPGSPGAGPDGGAPKLFVVSTRRGKQFNTLLHADVDPLTGAERDAIFIHPEDAAELHLVRGDEVSVVSDVGRMTGRIFPVLIARGNLQVHWPEGNVLIPRGVVDTLGGVPDYNTVVRLEKMAAAPGISPTPA